MRCAVLFQGTPAGLAGFAAKSEANEALLGQLLGDATLMRDMLLAGGAVSSEDQKGAPGPARYGEAMAIYAEIAKASAVLSNISSAARPSLIPALRTHFTRAGIEWRRCHHAVCMARP